jgi:hypothetical protein
MATRITALAALAFAGCTDTSEPTPPYDDIAATLGDQVAAERTALAQVTRIAHGDTPDGRYDVRCFSGTGKRIACGPFTVTATATAVWGDPDHFVDATWTLRGIDDELGLITSESWSVYGQRMTYKTGTLLYVVDETRIAAGSEDATIDADVAATVRYDQPPLVTLTVGERDYWLDEAGNVTLATQLE